MIQFVKCELLSRRFSESFTICKILCFSGSAGLGVFSVLLSPGEESSSFVSFIIILDVSGADISSLWPIASGSGEISINKRLDFWIIYYIAC